MAEIQTGRKPFISLTDVPSSYTGQANDVVTVLPTEDGLQFTAPGAIVGDHRLLTNRNAVGQHSSESAGTLSPYSINHLDVGGNTKFSNGVAGYVSEGVITAGTAVNSIQNLGNGICIFGTTASGHIFKSTDYGGQDNNNTWTDIGQITANGINAMTYLGNGLVVFGDSNGFLYMSLDFGINWTSLGQPAGAVNINSMAYLGNQIFIAGTSNGRIIEFSPFLTVGGVIVNFPLVGASSLNSITYLENGIAIAVDSGGKIFRSTNFGGLWIGVAGNPISFSAFFSSEYCGDGVVLVGDAGGHIFRSIDFGVSWTDINPLGFGAQINSIKYHGNGVVIFIQTNGRVFRSTDYGLTFSDLGDITGAAIPLITSTYLNNGVTIIGDNNGNIYRLDVSYKTDEAESNIDPSFVFTNTDITLGQSHNFVEVSALAANRTITIPAASNFQIGHEIVIKKTDSSANTVTISPATTIDGAATKVLNVQYQSISIRTDGNFWFIV